MVQETEVRVSPPTLGSGNPELGTDVLTQLVTKVLEEVKEIGETVQVRCIDCTSKLSGLRILQKASYGRMLEEVKNVSQMRV
ncbi:hypothetical protein J1N35_001583 [Gossypium stocksii]|uniref:Uncharacterized protein n=1 Tax=Gossypium stocksii TaxID=47602 RepID=A0A9D3WK63_9ROSI|nr:hypothetical protein J1N35_001583 [Gossypium stocksii]